MPNWYAVVQPGLEPVVVREFASLGVSSEEQPGGVRFSATLAEGARLVCAARTPTRILLELVEGPARSPEELAALVKRADWKKTVRPGAEVEVHATAARSRLHFRGSIENKVLHGLREALKGPRVVDRERRPVLTQRVQARVDSDRATLSIDAGGELLHVRGWRTEAGAAPLRENLAAALLIAAGWTGDEALVDPFCGSGTIPIEATLLALRRPPYTRRRFSFEEWPGLEKDLGSLKLHRMRVRSGPDVARAAQVAVLGADRDARVLGVAEENARRAGVEPMWRHCDVSRLDPPAPSGLVVANPPYGHRLGTDERALEGVWEAFGRTMRERFGGWRAIFLAPNPALAGRVHRNAKRMLTFSNGGLKVGMYVVESF